MTATEPPFNSADLLRHEPRMTLTGVTERQVAKWLALLTDDELAELAANDDEHPIRRRAARRELDDRHHVG